MTTSSSRGGRGRGGARGGGAVGDSYRRGPSWRGGPGAGGQPGGGYGRGGGGGGGPNAGPQGTPYVPGSGAAVGARRMSNSGAAPMARVGKDDKGGKGFQTDMDISAGLRGAERELKPWTPDADHGSNGASASNGGVQRERERDVLTFGEKPSTVPWDQFGDNERLFGVTTDYHEEIYTTKLDRSTTGYKKREREADRVAAEILSKTSQNSHIAEERGQQTPGDKDEEEKYSGVVRNPNAYVPPGARKGVGAGLPPRKDVQKDDAAAKDRKEVKKEEVKKDEPMKAKDIPLPIPLSTPSDLKSVTPPPAPHRSSADPAVDPAIASLGPGPSATTMTRSTSSAAPQQNGSDAKPVAPLSVDPIGAVVDQARQFVETERERAAQQKQSMVKNERANVLADFKKWQAKFKVPLPMPKDILPILTKDEHKQKAIEAKAEKERLEVHEKHVAAKSPAGSPSKALSPPPETTSKAPAAQPKKITMKIPEIPPFRPKVPTAVPVPVPESATQNIALVTSPTPSNTSLASGAGKLNPHASAFVFKPNANAPAFKPAGSTGVGGDSSAVTSPASQAAKLPAPSTPTQAPKNPFYPNGPPKRIAVNMRDDFNPFKHGQVPLASSVSLQWAYTGRRSSVAFGSGGPPMHQGHMPAPGGYEGDDPQSPHAQHAGPPPGMQGGIPPNLMPFYRYGPGVPPQMQQPGMPGMMYPGPGFMPQQMSSPGHGPQQGPNMQMFYTANGVPPNAHFLPHQMHFQHGPGRPVPQGQMYYGGGGQMPGGPQAPQMQQQMSYSGHPTPPQPHFQQPLPAQGPPGPSGPGAFDGSPGP